MALDWKEWGTIAALAGPDMVVAQWADLVVSCDDAIKIMHRDPDYRDSTITSWGRVTLDEARRLAALGPEEEFREETLGLIDELFASAELQAVTVYYPDPYRGI